MVLEALIDGVYISTRLDKELILQLLFGYKKHTAVFSAVLFCDDLRSPITLILLFIYVDYD